jgi:hypothetical protein
MGLKEGRTSFAHRRLAFAGWLAPVGYKSVDL